MTEDRYRILVTKRFTEVSPKYRQTNMWIDIGADMSCGMAGGKGADRGAAQGWGDE